jgi:hypothetical protein
MIVEAVMDSTHATILYLGENVIKLFWGIIYATSSIFTVILTEVMPIAS